MRLTRRQLLWTAAGGAAALSVQGASARNRRGVSVLLDSGNCLAQESAAGYRHGLEDLRYPVDIAAGAQSCQFRTIIVPACGALAAQTVLLLREKVEAGYHVVLESGIAFVDPPEAERQRALAKEILGLSIDPRISIPAGGTLHVRYRWPVDALVRQFGTPVAVGGPQWRPIARFRDISVAAVRPIGSGKMIFLGSPLGPSVFAEDREAQLLAQQLLRDAA